MVDVIGARSLQNIDPIYFVTVCVSAGMCAKEIAAAITRRSGRTSQSLWNIILQDTFPTACRCLSGARTCVCSVPAPAATFLSDPTRPAQQ